MSRNESLEKPTIVSWPARRVISKISLAVVLLCMTGLCHGQQAQNQKDSIAAQEERRPVADSHSFVELFTKLEDQWTQAIQRRDRSRLDAVLAPEFILRNSEDPEHPVIRERWMRNVFAGPEIKSFTHRAMVIRAFMGVAIVSFVEEEQVKSDGQNHTVRRFIVDVWEVNRGQWLAAERFVAPLTSLPAGVSPR